MATKTKSKPVAKAKSQAQAPRVKPLNLAQMQVLKAVSSGAKITSNVTGGEFVSGTAALALEKRGLVTRTFNKKSETVVKITPAGRKAAKG